MKKNLFCLFLFIMVSSNLWSQEDFIPGYVVTHGFDTISGFIQTKWESLNAKSCIFKKDLISESIQYTPEDIRSYRFDNGGYYVTKSVVVDGTEFPVFLEYLLKGIYNLYYLSYLGKDRYFIENQEGLMIELSNDPVEAVIGGKRYISNSGLYKAVLKSAFDDAPPLIPTVEKAELNHKSLIQLTKGYHEITCKEWECIVYEKESVPMRLRIGPTMGVHLLTLQYRKETVKWKPVLGNNYSAGLMTRLEFPRRNNRVSVDFMADYAWLYFYKYDENYASSSIIYTTNHLYLNQLRFKIAPRYSIPVSKFRFGFSGGVFLDLYSNIEIYETREAINNFIVSYFRETDAIELETTQIGTFAGISMDYSINRFVLFLTADVEFLPVNSGGYVDSQITGVSLSTGILF